MCIATRLKLSGAHNGFTNLRITAADASTLEPGSDAVEALRRILSHMPGDADELRAVVESRHARHQVRGILDDVLAEMRMAA